MKTALVTIGNSDNKLSQQDWSKYCRETFDLCHKLSTCVYFEGHSAGGAPYQNAGISFSIPETELDGLRRGLAKLADRFNQKAIALMVVDKTEMVTP